MLAPAAAKARDAGAADQRGDPQGLDRQAEALVAAGAAVHTSNAGAARRAAELAGGKAA